MKAVIVPQQGGMAEISTDIAVPSPSDTQILVKSLYAAVNPADIFMANMGLLVESWPLVPGCEASGIVVKAGKDAVSPLGEKFKEGDAVMGCVRLGWPGHGAWQEYFLLDAEVAIPKPENLSFEQACTVSVGVLTAFLGVFVELGVPLVDPERLPSGANEWAIVFGGASAVGKFTMQALKLAGYKVLTTCSKQSFDVSYTTKESSHGAADEEQLAKSFGADATIDYKASESEIIEKVKQITDSKIEVAFDAVAVNNGLVSSIFTAIPSTSGKRIYATTGDRDPAPDSSLGFVTKPIELGPIGRPSVAELNKHLNGFIPVIYKLLESGKLKAGEYSVEGEGVEGVLKAWEVQKAGSSNRKVIAKIASG